ncbi:ABC transporter permease [Cohnella thailandensis]|uniref:ABC transporter permease n=1 Tax=Cohnella thailandensis TaxID=557557 RepID=A0A841T903_9BACL|nr:ABC transporter permease [Cohnella thailandensis]MBB6637671.1 ABC transporter permease [Cohnella thailandensis]MBP1974152.1 ABC-2 type transport system permease protein [Cohnella thailandensis]
MSSLSQLIRNENMKIYFRPRTWLMVLFLVGTVALMSGIMKWDESRSETADWRASLTQQNEKMALDLQSSADMDEGSREYLQERITLNDYHLSQNINPDKLTLWSYVNSSASLIILVTLLTVVVAADMIAGEFTWGTIKLLLVGPASRTKIMLGKYISTMVFALLLLIVCFAAALIAGGILAGFDGLNTPDIYMGSDGIIHEGSMFLASIEKYGYNVVMLVMYVTMAFMISSAFRSSSMAIAFSLLCMLVGNTLSGLLSGYSWVKYLIFPNIDLTQYMEGATPLRPEMTLGFSIAMLAIYYVVFQFVAWLLFTKRDVAG